MLYGEACVPASADLIFCVAWRTGNYHGGVIHLEWGVPGACRCQLTFISVRMLLNSDNSWPLLKGSIMFVNGLPKWCLVIKNPPDNAGDLKRHGFDSWVKKIPWKTAGQPTPVFFPEESHGQRGLAGYSPWGCKELDITEVTQHTQNVCE